MYRDNTIEQNKLMLFKLPHDRLHETQQKAKFSQSILYFPDLQSNSLNIKQSHFQIFTPFLD